MLYKFKSKATGDLIMLEPNGRRVLEIMGKEAGPQGIVLPAQMAAAIDALWEAVAQEELAYQMALAEAKTQGTPAPKWEPISLRQRTLPMIEMLKQCLKANESIVWGV
jgi:hypothetical protein